MKMVDRYTYILLENLNVRLREAMCRKGITRTELAIDTGINYSMLKKYEKGKYIPRGSTVAALSRALDVAPEWLLCMDMYDKH